ncbi:MAG: hypothetical protein QXH27_04255, partial [Candidatus Micrarchaeia archaeon]
MHKTQRACFLSRLARRVAAPVLAAGLALSSPACAPGLSRLSYRNFGDVIYVEELGKALDVSAVRRMEGGRQFDVLRTRAGTFILGKGFSHLYRIDEKNQLAHVPIGSALTCPQPFLVGKTLVVYDSGRLITWRGEDVGLYQLGIAQATLLASEEALFVIGGKAAFLFTEKGLREIGVSGILAEEGVPEILEPVVKVRGENFS